MQTVTFDEAKWKLVPISPTSDMRDAWEGHYDGREPEQADHDEFVIRYAEMLAAAPEPAP